MNDHELKSRLDAELSSITWSVRNSNAVRQQVNQGGVIMKKKTSFSIISALVALFVLATVAYAATEIYRQVTWKGEPVEMTEELYHWAETNSDEDTSREEINTIIHDLIDDIPEEDYAEAWYRGDDFTTGNIHKKQKNFSSYEDFLQFMSAVDYLSVPVWLPENMNSFSAKVLMDSKVQNGTDGGFNYSFNEDGTVGYYKMIEEWKDETTQFRHCSLDDSDAIVTGYQLVIGFTDHHDITIYSELSISHGTSFGLESDETATPLNIDNMADALFITSPDQGKRDKLFLRRELSDPISFVSFVQGMQTSSEENVTVMAFDQDPETLVRIMTGE